MLGLGWIWITINDQTTYIIQLKSIKKIVAQKYLQILCRKQCGITHQKLKMGYFESVNKAENNLKNVANGY